MLPGMNISGRGNPCGALLASIHGEKLNIPSTGAETDAPVYRRCILWGKSTLDYQGSIVTVSYALETRPFNGWLCPYSSVN